MLAELAAVVRDGLEIVDLLLYAFWVALGELLVSPGELLCFACTKGPGRSELRFFVQKVLGAKKTKRAGVVREMLTFLDRLGLVGLALGLDGIDIALFGHFHSCHTQHRGPFGLASLQTRVSKRRPSVQHRAEDGCIPCRRATTSRYSSVSARGGGKVGRYQEMVIGAVLNMVFASRNENLGELSRSYLSSYRRHPHVIRTTTSVPVMLPSCW